STTTTTTTPPTTGTVTTRPLGTTTPNASLTTTGIIATSASTIQTTTVTTSTTTTTSPSTSVTTTTSTTTETEMNVMSGKDFEEYCRQPVAIATAVSMIGGLINWKPVDPYTNSSTVEVIIYQSHSWTLTRLHCDQALIDSLGLYVDGTSFTGQPFIACESPAGCSGTGFNTIRQVTFCTDFSTAVQISSGALIKKITLDRNTDILVGFTGNSWASEIKTSLNAVADYWRVITHIDLTQ
ncbi:unnamed protein product, partial [Rotaria sp. Silwood1]